MNKTKGKLRLLLLEDNHRDAELITYQLEVDGFEVDAKLVDTKSEFVDQLRDESYDVVLADFTLPQFNALEALLLMQQLKIEIPLIIVTGTISEEVAVKCMREGAADYLLKDRLSRLGQSVEHALQKHKLKQADIEQRRLQSLLRSTAVALTSQLDTQQVLNVILENIQLIYPMDGIGIWLIEKHFIRFVRGQGYSDAQVKQLAQLNFSVNDETVQQYLALEQVITFANSADNPMTFSFKDYKYHACVPIRAADTLYGFILMSSVEETELDALHIEGLEIFSYQVAIALENARLYEVVTQNAMQLEERVKQRTLQLQLAKDRVEKILNSTSDAVILLRPNGTLDQANPAFFEMFGINTRHIFGMSVLNYIDSYKTGVFQRALETFAEEGTYRGTMTAKRLDGAEFEADVVLSPIMSNPDLGIVCTIRDVTKQQMVEIELRNALDKERELNELKTRFVSMVSHEYRTPLAVIKSSTSILQNYWKRLSYEECMQYLTRMDNQIKHMTTLMDEVLSVGTTSVVANSHKFKPINIATFCENLVSEFSDISQHQLVMEVQSQHDIIAYVDSNLFRLVVRNLISNAIKYSDTGSTIRVTIAATDDGFSLSVQDSGIGIPEEDIPHLFEVFHRASNVDQIYGTGLGLAIVKQAVEAHGGSVDVTSKLGAGTTFKIAMPKTQLVGAYG